MGLQALVISIRRFIDKLLLSSRLIQIWCESLCPGKEGIYSGRTTQVQPRADPEVAILDFDSTSLSLTLDAYMGSRLPPFAAHTASSVPFRSFGYRSPKSYRLHFRISSQSTTSMFTVLIDRAPCNRQPYCPHMGWSINLFRAILSQSLIHPFQSPSILLPPENKVSMFSGDLSCTSNLGDAGIIPKCQAVGTVDVFRL